MYKLGVGVSLTGGGILALRSEKAREFLGIPSASAFSLPDDGLHAAHYPWDHRGKLKTFDHASLRRGYQVFKEVCSACHSMKYLSFRNLVGVTHTEEEAKAIAAEYDVTDGPNDQGEMFTRSGKVLFII
jgi:ubiquinol-cytochrome c reductase cytochrome c1 subunit